MHDCLTDRNALLFFKKKLLAIVFFFDQRDMFCTTITLGEFWEAEFIFELMQRLGISEYEQLRKAYDDDIHFFRYSARIVWQTIVSDECREYILRTKSRKRSD